MSKIDPDIVAFRDAESDPERAWVLLGAPLGTLLRWREVFDRLAANVDFAAGTAYLAALAEALRKRRHRGVFGTMELDGARTVLLGLVDSVPRPRTGHWREPLPEEAPSSPRLRGEDTETRRDEVEARRSNVGERTNTASAEFVPLTPCTGPLPAGGEREPDREGSAP